ncbi:MAG: hypothetical protein JSW17_04350 [Candidatus Omnitrophota bacterium]|nr:MAG: hypothetical protein JSW17_04350 [Candidatus Omnitrophota bacterium]
MISKIKRTSINIVLITIFIALMVTICSLFGAEINFIMAKQFEAKHQWSKAQVSYKKAMFFSPFSAKYITGLAGLFLRQSAYRTDKLSLFKKAESLCVRALELNPYSVQCMLALGRTQIRLFLKNKEIYGEKLGVGLESLNKALSNDPNGFRTAYFVGHTGMLVWDFLNENEKKMVVDRLKHALKYRWPQYFKNDYNFIWQATQDFTLLKQITPQNLRSYKVLYNFMKNKNLWQFRKGLIEAMSLYMLNEDPQGFEQEQKDKMIRIGMVKKKNKLTGRRITNVISRQLWEGRGRYKGQAYRNGNMYWEGTMDAVLTLPKGESVIEIEARGLPAEGIYPYMVVELDGIEIGEGFVDNSEWREYSFNVSTSSGIKVLSITYENDRVYGGKGGDRNLYIGNARVIKNE